MRIIIDTSEMGGMYYDPEAVGFAVDFDHVPEAAAALRRVARDIEAAYRGSEHAEMHHERDELGPLSEVGPS